MSGVRIPPPPSYVSCCGIVSYEKPSTDLPQPIFLCANTVLMNTPEQRKNLATPEDIFQKSDKELVLMSVTYEWNENTRSLAKAEQVRRQTEAVNNFNKASTRLAWIMIGLAVVNGLLALFQLVALFIKRW